jgi:hypothetical protein
MLNSDKTANDFIVEVCDKHLLSELTDAVRSRLEKGEKEYGHKIRIMDDTTTWGTKNNSWLDMAVEEIADAIIYVLTHHLRLIETNQVTEISYQMTMLAVRQLSEVYNIMNLIPPK